MSCFRPYLQQHLISYIIMLCYFYSCSRGKILDGRNRAMKNKELATNELQCLSVERVIEA